MREQSSYAPICLFVYNRLDHTKRTVDALLQNTESKFSDLIVFSDGPKQETDREKITNLREYLRTVKGFRHIQIIERERNQGLAKSIIDGVSKILSTHATVIVLEDDIVTSPHFLRYMNEALATYENDEKVASIHGYLAPLDTQFEEPFFLRGADCWGWATWRRAWRYFDPNGVQLLQQLREKNLTYEFDLDGTYPYTEMLENQIAGRVNSWAIRWHASTFLKEMVTMYPPRTLVRNIGFDGSGVHSGESDGYYDVELSSGPVEVIHLAPQVSIVAREAYKRFCWKNRVTFWSKVRSAISRRFRYLLEA